MALVLVTGSSDGIGRETARLLARDGHDVITHARNDERLTAAHGLGERHVVVADLASRAQTMALAEQVNRVGPIDAVVHNAGVYDEGWIATPEGHSRVLAVNVLAPYLLTVLIRRPARLVYLSSDMHPAGSPELSDLAWTERPWNSAQAYSDSKLLITALALAVARYWPAVRSNAVDPGWVATKMGGPGAPIPLHSGADTQAWLAAGTDPATDVTGAYWHQRRQLRPAPTAADHAFQDAMLARLAEVTGVGYQPHG